MDFSHYSSMARNHWQMFQATRTFKSRLPENLKSETAEDVQTLRLSVCVALSMSAMFASPPTSQQPRRRPPGPAPAHSCPPDAGASANTLRHKRRKERVRRGWGGGGGGEIRPLQKYNLFFVFLGPLFFSQRRLGVWQSARGTGDNGTLCTSRSPETPRWSIGPLVGGTWVAALHRKGALQRFEAELALPSACTEHIDLTG